MSLSNHPNCLSGGVIAPPVSNGGTGATSLGANLINSGSVLDTIQGIRTSDTPQFSGIGIGASLTTGNLQDWTQSTAGIGTVSITSGSKIVTGVGTSFGKSLRAGDSITINGETQIIKGAASDTTCNTYANWGQTISGQNYTISGGARAFFQGNGTLVFGSSPSNDVAVPITILTNNFLTDINLGNYIINVNDTAVRTSVGGTFAGQFIGLIIGNQIGSTNTQNWTATANGGGFVGVLFNNSMNSGATGTISLMGAGYFQAHIGNSGTCTTLYAIQVGNAATSGGTLTNAYGIGIANQTAATNNTNLLLGTLTPPSGNFDIYSASVNPSQIGGSFQTGDPSSGAAAWKLGTIRSGAALVQDTTRGVQVSIGGTVVTLAVLTTNP